MKRTILFNNFFLILLAFAFNGCEKGIDATVVEVDEEVCIKMCNAYNHRYVIIGVDDFVIPPRDNDFIQTDKMA